jgi:hypothetical protein
MQIVRRKREKTDATADEAKLVRDTIRRMTAGLPDGPLRPDLARLQPGERVELADLIRKGWAGTAAFSMSRLTLREHERLELLVEQSAGKEPGSVFRADRENARLLAEFRRLDREARRPGRRVALDEPGSLTIPSAWLLPWFEHEHGVVLEIGHWGLLIFIATQLETATPLSPNSRIEGVGENVRLVLDMRKGLGGRFDLEGRFVGWPDLLRHLHTIGLLTVDIERQEVRVGFGPRYLRKFPRAA